ncbi:uncharacterized protein LOC110019675 isoform X2 [Phalaenopsis equestris]|uniref:uncharacterized protein LOC110019675 isoform X2 n=1 Tax=Phalaenopsis equestris TaxID=78828 RepID=UPI0009E310C8|nr:uncharacterized protein LOC110019675 isoform X2 [Phalaenopsis equestris]
MNFMFRAKGCGESRAYHRCCHGREGSTPGSAPPYREAYELETNYLQQSAQCGSVLQGFEGYLSSTRRTNNVRRSKRVPLKDRLFSLSSATSPANSVSSIVSDGIGRRDLAISIVMRQADLKVDGKVGLLKLRQRG